MPVFDKKDKSRYDTFTRRSVGMGGGISLVFAVLAGRLYQLQIRNGEEYRVAAEDNRVSERPIAPPRDPFFGFASSVSSADSARRRSTAIRAACCCACFLVVPSLSASAREPPRPSATRTSTRNSF